MLRPTYIVSPSFGEPLALLRDNRKERGVCQRKRGWQLAKLETQAHSLSPIAPYMIGRKYGKIINMSSIYGKSGGIAAISYSAAKGGIIGLTKSIAKELGKSNITVNAVLPGLTDTPTIRKMPERYKKMIIEATALRRMARPEEIANVVTFLASDESSYITGATIEVTGGWMM